jgi:nitronate monooxygenase
VAAGGISDGRGIAAAFALGADAVQIGTAYLRTPEATTSPMHRAALASARDDATRLTNVFTGRPARGLVNRFVAEVGPMCEDAPQFPLAAGAAAPLRTAGEKRGSGDFSPLWAGESAALAREEGAEALTRRLWAEGQAVIFGLRSRATA